MKAVSVIWVMSEITAAMDNLLAKFNFEKVQESNK